MKQFFNKNISKILTIFILLHPILDVISGINNNILNTDFKLNVIIRIIFLLFCLFYLLFINKTKHRKWNLIYLGMLFIYFILFNLSIINFKGIEALFYETKNFILSFYFPILLVTFFNMFDEYNIKINLKYLYYTLLLYLSFIFIPNITGLSFESYTQGKVGSSGWFNSANAISSIISILIPLILIYLKEKKFNFKYIVLLFIFLYVILSLGTKVPLLSLMIIIFCNILLLVISLFKNKKYKTIGIISTCLVVSIIGLILIIPKTSFYQNIKIHLDFLGVENVSQIVTDYRIIDRFIFSDRLTFLLNTKKVYDNSPISLKLIGIGYIENYATDSVSTKLIEMDYYDIFYRHGIIGSIIFFIPLIYIMFKLIKTFNSIDFKSLNYLISIILIFVLAFFSGHILTVPNVSFFSSLLLVITYYRNNNKLNEI